MFNTHPRTFIHIETAPNPTKAASQRGNTIAGSATLVNGTVAVDIPGLNSLNVDDAPVVQLTLREALGTLGAHYLAEVAANLLTISSVTTGGVVVATDQSRIFYTIIT